MSKLSKAGYWTIGFLGTAIWTSAIIVATGLPLPAQLALGSMGLMACIWGHSVLFAAGPQATIPQAGTTQAARPQTAPLPLGEARRPVSRARPGHA